MLIILEDFELAELAELADKETVPGAVEEDKLVAVELSECSTFEPPPVVMESLRFRLVVLVRVDEEEDEEETSLAVEDEVDEELDDDDDELDMDVLSGAWLLVE